jgi:HD-GYP domain-containing protein (c-di-GMP phosphodiesterase class II)
MTGSRFPLSEGRLEFSSVIVFFGLISIVVGLILAYTLNPVDRSAGYWIAGAFLSGLAALLRTSMSAGGHLLAVSVPNSANLFINVLFALSIRALMDKPMQHQRLLVGGAAATAGYVLVHEFAARAGSAVVELVVNPLVQIGMASAIAVLAVRLYRERGFRFAAALAMLQGMLALLWAARLFTGLAQGRIDFAALSVVNAFIFTPLMLVGTIRLLCYLALRLEEYAAKVDKSGVAGLLGALNALALSRDNETCNHILRTQKYVELMANNLLRQGRLQTHGIRDFVQLLHDVTPLHDIGKVGIPDSILRKPGKLDPEEWETMRTHAMLGANIIDSARTPETARDSRAEHALQIARQVALGHHENWDGSGYPQQLAGNQIPQPAQLVAIADAYDALRSVRVYKAAWSHEDAVADIVGLAGRRFDPDLVGVFVVESDRFREIADRYRD